MAARLASLCTIALIANLAPNLAIAAPPDHPAVQRPTETSESNTSAGKNDAQPVTEDTGNTASGSEDPGPSETPSSDAGVDPSPDDAPEGEDPPATQPEGSELPSHEGSDRQDQQEDPAKEDLSNLLVSDEPDETPRARVSRSSQPTRVDRGERLRNYYAKIYRPEHNPSRVYFAARGAFALAGTIEGTGGGRMGVANVEAGQTWNFIGYGLGATVMAGSLTFGESGVERFGGLLVGGGPSISIGRLGLLGRGYLDPRIGYSFFYAPVSTTRVGMVDPPDAAPHGPKVQIDAGLLVHGSERRRFRHGLGVSIGWQLLVHTFTGEYPIVNSFSIGVGYFFG